MSNMFSGGGGGGGRRDDGGGRRGGGGGGGYRGGGGARYGGGGGGARRGRSPIDNRGKRNRSPFNDRRDNRRRSYTPASSRSSSAYSSRSYSSSRSSSPPSNRGGRRATEKPRIVNAPGGKTITIIENKDIDMKPTNKQLWTEYFWYCGKEHARLHHPLQWNAVMTAKHAEMEADQHNTNFNGEGGGGYSGAGRGGYTGYRGRGGYEGGRGGYEGGRGGYEGGRGGYEGGRGGYEGGRGGGRGWGGDAQAPSAGGQGDQPPSKPNRRPMKFPPQARAGDWLCPNCRNLLFAFRSECNRCGGLKVWGETAEYVPGFDIAFDRDAAAAQRLNLPEGGQKKRKSDGDGNRSDGSVSDISTSSSRSSQSRNSISSVSGGE